MCYNPLEEEGKKKGYKQCTYETTFEGPFMHVMVQRSNECSSMISTTLPTTIQINILVVPCKLKLFFFKPFFLFHKYESRPPFFSSSTCYLSCSQLLKLPSFCTNAFTSRSSPHNFHHSFESTLDSIDKTNILFFLKKSFHFMDFEIIIFFYLL